jgi:anti-anti-sigma factor
MAEGNVGDRPSNAGQTVNVTTTVAGNVQIVSVSGRLDSITAESFDAHMQPIVGANGPRVVLDLTHVNYVASAGLRSLLMLARQITAKSGALVLAAVQPRVQDVFEIAGFTTSFAIAPTKDAALASLQPAR